MKQFKLYAIGLGLALITIVSCKKDNEDIPPSEIMNIENSEFSYKVESKIDFGLIKLKSKEFQGKNGSSNMLVFKDMEGFNTTLQELERQTNELDSVFVLFYKNLSEDSINAKEEEIGFDELVPLYDFENHLNFNSLHQKIREEMDIFLSQENPDWNNSPDDYYITDKTLRVLLNRDAEVIIGNSIYKFNEDGTSYEIKDKNMRVLQKIENGENPQSLKNVFVHNMENLEKATPCKTNKSKSGYIASGKYRIKWKVKMYNYPWQCGMLSDVVSYKKKKKKWKQHRTNLYVGVEGKYCSGSSLSASTGWNYRPGNNKKSRNVKITRPCQTKSGQVHGYHSGNGITYNSTLTF